MNSYSTIHNFDTQNLYRPDFQFVQTALNYKQNKLDTNRAKLQNLYDQYSILKVHNEVDQDYIEQRLQTVKDITNKYASMDLSDDNFATSLMGTVSQVLDENVKNAVLSTKLIESEDAQWAKMRDSKPELYSDLNRSYALNNSDRKNYENAQKAGTVYRGGAGFIEYRDLSKKIMDNLPKLQDALKAKWIQTGPQEGYFKSILTHESVSKEKLSDAVGLLFDEKDKMQMGINAWGTYDKLPDEVIKADYNNFIQPEIDNITNQINNLEIIKANPKQYQMTDAQVEEKLAYLNQSKADLEANTYEKVVGAYGRKGAYQNLYSQKFKKQIVDTYSYDNITDKKIDEVQKENVLYQQKVEQFELNYALDYAKFELEKERVEIAKIKALGGAGKTGSTAAFGYNDPTITVGDKIEIPNDSIDQVLIQKQKDEKESMDGIKNIVGSYVSRDDFADIKKQMGDLAGKAKRGESIKINGKDVKVKENLSALLAFKDNILEETPVEKSIKDKLQNTTNYVLGNLRQLVQSGSADFNVSNLPEYTWKIEVDPTTGKQKKVDLQNKNSQNYVRLLKKDKSKLTESEKATLTAYTQFHIIGDEGLELSNGVRKELYYTLRDKTLSGMSSKEFTKEFGRSEQDIVRTFTRNSFTGNLSRNITPKEYMEIAKRYTETKSEKDLQALKIANEKWYGKANFMKPMKGEGGYLSDLEYGDVEYYNKQGKEVSLKRFNDVIQSGMLSLEDEMSELKKQYNLVEYMPPILSKDNQFHRGVKSLMVQQGQITDDYKGSITVKEVFNSEGKPTDEVDLVAVEKVKGEPVERTARVSKEAVAGTGFKLVDIKKEPYDASFGVNARKIQLGKASPQDNPNDYLIQNLKPLLSQAEALGIGSEVKSLVSQYYNGQIDFSIEADQGLYKMVARDASGKVLPGSYPMQQTVFDYSDIEYIYSNAEELQSEAMEKILQDFMGKSAVMKQLSTQKEGVSNLLR